MHLGVEDSRVNSSVVELGVGIGIGVGTVVVVVVSRGCLRLNIDRPTIMHQSEDDEDSVSIEN